VAKADPQSHVADATADRAKGAVSEFFPVWPWAVWCVTATCRRIAESSLGTRFAGSVCFSNASGRVWPGVAYRRADFLKIVVEMPDLEEGRSKSHAVGNYVRAAIKVQVLRREFASACVEMRRCRQALSNRAQAESLMAELKSCGRNWASIRTVSEHHTRVEDFTVGHRPHGRLTADMGALMPNGYRLIRRVPAG
jgi:hypothetical protein